MAQTAPYHFTIGLMRMIYDTLLYNARLLMPDGLEKSGQALAIHKGHIAWCGELSAAQPLQAIHWEDCQGRLVTPGLIDCHTHLVYAGNRAQEFKLRLTGSSYAQIAQAGGGILSTVQATRAASKDVLMQQSLPRLQALAAEGVTCVEIKSGYGLDLNNEIKMLEVARQLGVTTGLRVQTTFLGAHAIPLEYHNKNQDYVDYLCQEMLPAIAERKLADAVDVFCEQIAFTIAQTEQIFMQAHRLGLPIKCHAEQLSNMGATQLAASLGALSCDHLEYLEENAVRVMKKQGTVAVLLPGAFYFLKEEKRPPVELLRKHEVPIAIATDCNPGSSPTTSLLLMMSMACHYFSLTIPEVLLAVTTHAAQALGLKDKIGALKPGQFADLVRWDINDSAILCYHFGSPISHQTMIGGHWLPNKQ